jgi:hypothetical protein
MANQKAADLAPECFTGDEKILVWGDSHAAALSYGMNRIAKENGLTFGQATASACPPLLGFEVRGRVNCGPLRQRVLEQMEGFEGHVYLHANWYKRWQDDSDTFFSSLDETLAALNARGVKYSFILSVPQWPVSAPRSWVQNQSSATGDAIKMVKNPILADLAEFDAKFEKYLVERNIATIDLLGNKCLIKEGVCQIGQLEGDEIKLFQWDYGHLTKEGSENYARAVLGAKPE